ncbi:SDR family NAD(P)-dependent oxidoreductase [Actinoplanes couchii]|uniref:Dehydrogenase n=1 Tax=Actinoplanes couchii TaxID=403638 RepID=A0ABQ3X531_9ACTN|nr:SDR family oxidoreductase [Actinoplanes couchii]MDR6326017.1 short-subunit dehydrogenase [Actinoplanes couchii]GID53630.1 dehydrogenase [Actinoplanes couchii]
MAVDYRNQTTLITGASSGLGALFARRLAARGSNLILVARRTDRLESLAASLPQVRVTTIGMDLAQPGAGAKLAAETAERGLTVTSLINNAGFGTHTLFHEADPQRITDEITLNVTSLTEITREFIGPLRAHGGGVLVNVASIAAYHPGPTLAVYAATKAYVLSFTEALWAEAHGTGLRVMALSPGPTKTEFFEVAGENADGGMPRMSADRVVDLAMRALDRRNPPPSLVTGLPNRIAVGTGRLAGRRFTIRAMGTLMRQSIRR